MPGLEPIWLKLLNLLQAWWHPRWKTCMPRSSGSNTARTFCTKCAPTLPLHMGMQQNCGQHNCCSRLCSVLLPSNRQHTCHGPAILHLQAGT